MIGDIVIVRYLDHVQFSHSTNPTALQPIEIWTIGIIAHETPDSLTLLNEIYPTTDVTSAVLQANGFLVLKTNILSTTKLLANNKTALDKRVSKGIKTIEPTQNSLSMRSKNEKLKKVRACK